MITRGYKNLKKVFIPTAGLGSRLDRLTQNINKSMVDVGFMPIISRIINTFGADKEYVIALGFKGKLVQDFIKSAYPDLEVTFVHIDNYDGKGSGLGYTLYKCKEHLQCSFLFCSCDTLVDDFSQSYFSCGDWIGYSSKISGPQYRSLEIKNEKLLRINDKNIASNNSYIGLAYISNFTTFWEAIDNNKEAALAHGEVYGINFLTLKHEIKCICFNWHDTGNLESLEAARLHYNDNEKNILYKDGEAIWFVNGKVFKYSDNEKFIAGRVTRSSYLSGYVPECTLISPNLYSYAMVRGTVISRCITVNLLKELLDYAKQMWLSLPENDKVPQSEFEEICQEFYYTKTLSRLKSFLNVYPHIDCLPLINGMHTEPIHQLLAKLDWACLSQGLQGNIHGDFHFENILYNSESSDLTLIDWRQGFGSSLTTGDVYYDLAKLLHGIILPHSSVTKGLYSVNLTECSVNISLERPTYYDSLEKELERFCHSESFSYVKVQKICSLIFLNIASLHHFPYSLYLFTIGKYMLSRSINK